MKTGVYVHIPFCVSKCGYCDFLSFSDTDELRTPYIGALINEISHCEDLDGLALESVFFGGGTPSLLNEKEIAAILEAITSKTDASSAEITLEANPASGSFPKLASIRACGFNRLSIGLQSAQDHLLKALGRTHTLAGFLDIHETAVRSGFTNINADIMFGLPGQTADDLNQTIDLLTCLKIPHISAYSLTIEEATPFGKMFGEGDLKLQDEDSERGMYLQIRENLKNAGYANYEISNFAHSGRECRHNILYWTRQNYLGFGLGAHSLVNNTRRRNTRDISAYITANGNHSNLVRDIEILDTASQMAEFIFLGLRMTNGISLTEFLNQFGVNLSNQFGAQILKYQNHGLLETQGDRLRFTPEGINVSNIILADFL